MYINRLLLNDVESLALDESVDEDSGGAGFEAAVFLRLVIRNWVPISGCCWFRDDDEVLDAAALDILRLRALFRWLLDDDRAELGFSWICKCDFYRIFIF